MIHPSIEGNVPIGSRAVVECVIKFLTKQLLGVCTVQTEISH